jgi:hypothetical protein
MRAFTLTLAVGILAVLADSAQADGQVTISKAVAADFASYQQTIGGVGSGAYAITEDGQGGASAGCTDGNCQSKAGQMAIDKCQQLNPGRTCVLFARNREPVVEYQVGQ